MCGQGCMYRKESKESRAANIQELAKQLDVLEHWIQGEG